MNPKSSFDGYFTNLDYEQTTFIPSPVFAKFKELYKGEKLWVGDLLKFIDTYKKTNHPDLENIFKQQFGLEFSLFKGLDWSNTNQCVGYHIQEKYLRDYPNGSMYLISCWHKLRDALINDPRVEFTQIDLLTAKIKIAGKEYLYDEYVFYRPFIDTIVDIHRNHDRILLGRKIHANKPESLKNYETYLDFFILNAVCDATLLSKGEKHAGSMLLARLLYLKKEQLSLQKVA